ncbi:DUF6894 family protein [Methylobacterium sp. A49B]
MARYFFDVSNGETVTDDDGIEFTDAHRASKEALQSLPDMAKDLHPSSEPETVTITVRDESGTALYRATLTIEGTWLQDQQ